MKRVNSGTYQLRFDRLWSALAVCDSRAAGEVSPEIVSGIIGCSLQTARRLLWTRIRGFYKRGNYV
jgi:hypothetical protein